MSIDPEEAEEYSQVLTSMSRVEFITELANHFTPEQCLLLVELLVRAKGKPI